MTTQELKSIDDALRYAINTHNTSHIVYLGGRTPGCLREIVPIRLVDGKLSAHDPKTRTLKCFKTEKISSIILGDGRRFDKPVEAAAPGVHAKNLSTLNEYARAMASKYEVLGWHVVFNEATQTFGIGRYFKSGKPQKTPVLTLSHEPAKNSLEIDQDTGEILTAIKPTTGRERPWRVRERRGENCVSFMTIHKAVLCFERKAGALVP